MSSDTKTQDQSLIIESKKSNYINALLNYSVFMYSDSIKNVLFQIGLGQEQMRTDYITPLETVSRSRVNQVKPLVTIGGILKWRLFKPNKQGHRPWALFTSLQGVHSQIFKQNTFRFALGMSFNSPEELIPK